MMLAFPCAAFAVSLILTRVGIAVLPFFGFMDIPKGRHIHAKPVPRGGGIAIVLAFFFGLGLYLLQTGWGDLAANKALMRFLRVFWLPCILIFATGVLDDRYDLKSWFKLGVQILAGILIYQFGGGMRVLFGIAFPWYVGMAITVFWTVLIINAFNLIDGLDGLAAGLAAISAICLALWAFLSGGSKELIILLLIFCASCLGFLRYNFSPARIFMGDAGSTFIGLFFATVSMELTSKSVTVISIVIPLLAFGVPIFDVMLAVWRRSMRRLLHNAPNNELAVPDSNVMEADCDHLHHRILRQAHKKTSRAVLTIYSIAAILALTAVVNVLIAKDARMNTVVFIILVVVIIQILRLASIESLDTFAYLSSGLRFPRKTALMMSLHPIYDVFAVLFAHFATAWMFGVPLRATLNLTLILALCGPPILFLCFSGIYWTYWLRAGIDRYFQLFKTLFFSALISFAALCVLHNSDFAVFEPLPTKEIFRTHLMFFFIMLFLICGERFLLRYVESFGLRTFYLKTQQFDSARTAIVYGGGLGCRLYLQFLYSRYRLQRPFRILGALDEDPNLLGRNVYGLKVIGDSSELEKIYDKTPFHIIVVTIDRISPHFRTVIEDFCRKKDVRLLYFIHRELPGDSKLCDSLMNESRETPAEPSR